MHIIITGGSSGIGLALARAYLTRGASVTIIGRSPQRLEEAGALLASSQPDGASRLYLGAADVRDESGLVKVVEAACARFGACDLMVSCAGIVAPVPFEQLTAERFAEQVDINLVGTANAVRAVYASMKQRGGGTVLIVSSGAALIGLHGYTAYCASKAALVGFAESLRMEAELHGVRIAICYPPDTDTPQLAGELPLRSREAAHVMGRLRPWAADVVAGKIVRSLERGRRDIHFGGSLALLARFGPLVKPMLYWWFLRGMRRLK